MMVYNPLVCLCVCICLQVVCGFYVPLPAPSGRTGGSVVYPATRSPEIMLPRDYRNISSGAFESENQVFSFRYTTPSERRRVSDARAAAYKGPPVRIFLLGKPSSGKGTIAPMLSRAYRGVTISTGNLLRAEVKVGSDLGKIAEEQMQKGEMMPSRLLLSLLIKRLTQGDCASSSWILDGFPRSPDQAVMLREVGLEADCIVVLDRPDELVREFALGRMIDSATGAIYHPKFNPAPPEVEHRLVWRTDDTSDAIERRLALHHQTIRATLEAYADVPMYIVNSARSEIETFNEICDFVEEVAAKKLASMNQDAIDSLAHVVDARSQDIAPLTDDSEVEGVTGDTRTLLAAVKRCNKFDIRQFVPVFIEESKVGYVDQSLASDIRSGQFGSAVEIRDDHCGCAGAAVVLAPYADTPTERTQVLEGLVHALVQTGVVPKTALRNELQDITCITRMGTKAASLARMERAAMIHFGVPSMGVHVNGYVADKETGKPHSVWIGVRSAGKATYPGLRDQVVAGGVSAGASLYANVARECEEEASIPKNLVVNLQSAGQISYRYATRKGLSTKILTVYDLELPDDFYPFNGDGEVEEFLLLTIPECLDSIRNTLQLWKPNCALVMIDFAVRHGFVDPDDPEYMEICHLLRAGWSPYF